MPVKLTITHNVDAITNVVQEVIGVTGPTCLTASRNLLALNPTAKVQMKDEFFTEDAENETPQVAPNADLEVG